MQREQNEQFRLADAPIRLVDTFRPRFINCQSVEWTFLTRRTDSSNPETEYEFLNNSSCVFAGYRSGTVNSNTVNSKFHLIRSFFKIFARFLSFHI